MQKNHLLFFILFYLLMGCSNTFFIGARLYNINEFYDDPIMINFIEATLSHDFQTAESLLSSHNVDVNAIGKDEMTVLLISFFDNNIEAFTKFLEWGANPNYVSEGRSSILYFCIGDGEPPYLEELLKHGADPNRDLEGRNLPLYNAIITGATKENFELLLKYGADPNFNQRREPIELYTGEKVYLNDFIFSALNLNKYFYIPILLENGSKLLEHEESKLFFIQKLESEEQGNFIFTKGLSDQQELVEYLKNNHGIEINLYYPNGKIF